MFQTSVKECFILQETEVGNPFLALTISPLHSVQAGVKSANPVLSERYGYENRLQVWIYSSLDIIQ